MDDHLLQIFFGVADLRWIDEERLLIQPDWPLLGFRRIREPLGNILLTDPGGRKMMALNNIPPRRAASGQPAA